MWSWLLKCWRPVAESMHRLPSRHVTGTRDDEDEMLWSRSLGRHAFGEFSIAVVQGNIIMEDHSQVETGPSATFVGVYDGHGGPEAAMFVADHLFRHHIELARERGTISEQIIKNAYSATEDKFLDLVREKRPVKPLIAAVGSCCLTAIICGGILYVANLGDSRAVIGQHWRHNDVMPEQITKDHNASSEEVRRELMARHPDDPNIVMLKDNIWRVKGLIQISRSIGDAFLKKPEFHIDASVPRFGLPEPIRRPVLEAVPVVYRRVLTPKDKFLVVASDGLWEQLSNPQVTDIISHCPRDGIAKRLVKAALEEAARKRGFLYEEMRKLDKTIRRPFHDDISVIVIYFDDPSVHKKQVVYELSIRGFRDVVTSSLFSLLDGMTLSASRSDA